MHHITRKYSCNLTETINCDSVIMIVMTKELSSPHRRGCNYSCECQWNTLLSAQICEGAFCSVSERGKQNVCGNVERTLLSIV